VAHIWGPHWSPGDTAEQLGDLCISAEARAEMLRILEVWRLHKWDAAVSLLWRQGHKGTTMGDLMGRRIRSWI